MVGQDWNHCLEYEFQIRKEALRRAEEDGLAIGAALWATCNRTQHRMEHWITFLTVANARSEKDKQTENTALENKVNALEKQLANIRNNRSRSPRKQLPSQKNLGQKSRVHVVAKVEVAEKAPEKVNPEESARTALQPLQVRRVRRISKRSRRSMVSSCSIRKLDRVQESVSDSRSTRVSILENAGGSTSAPYNDCCCLESAA